MRKLLFLLLTALLTAVASAQPVKLQTTEIPNRWSDFFTRYDKYNVHLIPATRKQFSGSEKPVGKFAEDLKPRDSVVYVAKAIFSGTMSIPPVMATRTAYYPQQLIPAANYTRFSKDVTAGNSRQWWKLATGLVLNTAAVYVAAKCYNPLDVENNVSATLNKVEANTHISGGNDGLLVGCGIIFTGGLALDYWFFKK